MTDTLSLGPVLDLIERWQDARSSVQLRSLKGGPSYETAIEHLRDVERLLLADVDISALRALTEQHAWNLRILYKGSLRPSGAVDIDAAANFLAAPRREPEAE